MDRAFRQILGQVSAKPRFIRGDDLIYRFLRDLFADEERFGDVARALLGATAIWLPPSVFRELPVLAPYVVRDPSCRGAGSTDQWASPDSAGFVRDDNSLIKGMPRSLKIDAPSQGHLHGRRMATEFVAAHVWRVTADGGPLASRRPLLNSFVPNLVWLPSQIAKLTDLEGGTVQRTLQEMSWSLYRDAPVEPHLVEVVAEAWSLLRAPSETHAHEFASWNYFIATERFMKFRIARVHAVVAAIDDILLGKPLTTRLIATRYTEGLPSVPHDVLRGLRSFLSRFDPAV